MHAHILYSSSAKQGDTMPGYFVTVSDFDGKVSAFAKLSLTNDVEKDVAFQSRLLNTSFECIALVDGRRVGFR
jgi:hypothetical protein